MPGPPWLASVLSHIKKASWRCAQLRGVPNHRTDKHRADVTDKIQKKRQRKEARKQPARPGKLQGPVALPDP